MRARRDPAGDESFTEWMGKKTKARMTLTNPDWSLMKPGVLIEARSGPESIVWQIVRRDFKRNVIFMKRPDRDKMDKWLEDQKLINPNVGLWKMKKK